MIAVDMDMPERNQGVFSTVVLDALQKITPEPLSIDIKAVPVVTPVVTNDPSASSPETFTSFCEYIELAKGNAARLGERLLGALRGHPTLLTPENRFVCGYGDVRGIRHQALTPQRDGAEPVCW